MTVLKTKNYDMFKFRDDNRERISPAHVASIKKSIEMKNMLHMRPISVNANMEVIDGQNRLMAAKALGVEIYYEKNEDLTPGDIILMNVSKSWGMSDYLNFYVKNGYPEYIKLKEFMHKNKVSLKIAMTIMLGVTWKSNNEFKHGLMKFRDEFATDELDICWETIEYIKKMNGFSLYTTSARFWMALIKLVRHVGFNADQWRQNLKKMAERFGPRPSIDDYSKLFMQVYNWNNKNKINILEE